MSDSCVSFPPCSSLRSSASRSDSVLRCGLNSRSDDSTENSDVVVSTFSFVFQLKGTTRAASVFVRFPVCIRHLSRQQPRVQTPMHPAAEVVAAVRALRTTTRKRAPTRKRIPIQVCCCGPVKLSFSEDLVIFPLRSCTLFSTTRFDRANTVFAHPTAGVRVVTTF